MHVKHLGGGLRIRGLAVYWFIRAGPVDDIARRHIVTVLQKLQVRQSEIRERLNALLAVEERSEEERGELETLTTEGQALEPEIRAAIVASGDGPELRVEGDAEGRELRALIDGSNAGEVFAAAVDHGAPEGRTAELQQHFKLAQNAVPLVLLEQRAVASVPAAIESTTAPAVMPVFATGDAAFLGVRMASVGVGAAVFPVLTSRPTVGGPHKGDTAVAVTDGVFTAASLEPGRLQASFEYRRSDAARFGDLDRSLRSALSEGLSEALDKEVIDQIVTDVARTDATAENTFATYRSVLVYGRLDGRYAKMESDVRILMGSATAVHASGEYRGNNADDSAIDSLRRISGGVRISAHVAGPGNTNKQDAIVRRGSDEAAVAALWAGVTLIPDEVTGAKTGKIILTAVLQAAFKVTRTAGFARIQTQHA